MITEKILDTGDEAVDSDIELRFDSDTGNEDQFDGSKFNIAIVDATPASQQAISAEFAKVNIKTAVFGNGQSLIQAVKTQKFDLIILDLYLPDVNGFQLLNYFKQQNFQTPILVHSMTPSKQFVVQALQFGAKGFIGKPQKPEVVLQKSIEIIKNTAI
jgi:DNA-binding response OmpR family regulator